MKNILSGVSSETSPKYCLKSNIFVYYKNIELRKRNFWDVPVWFFLPEYISNK